MKSQATKKVIINGHDHIISVGYGNLHYLLQQEQPYAYTAGVYGWNADIYSYGGVAICTGYRSFGDIKPHYDLIKEYEYQAREINISTHDWTKRKELKKALIEQFIKEVKQCT